MLETTSSLMTGFVLPLIMLILKQYGVDVKGGVLDSEVDKELDPKYNAVFKVMELDTSGSKNRVGRKFNDLTPEAQDVVRRMGEHLHFRLLKKRRNLNGPELLAMWVDPVGKHLFDIVCGDKKAMLREGMVSILELPFLNKVVEDAVVESRAEEEKDVMEEEEEALVVVTVERDEDETKKASFPGSPAEEALAFQKASFVSFEFKFRELCASWRTSTRWLCGAERWKRTTPERFSSR
jgi:hypothetical protein